MTIVFSAATSDFIVMTVDEVITDTFAEERRFKQERKGYHYTGIGCITTWGERRGNTIGTELLLADLTPAKHSFHDLDQLVDHFLREKYRPHEFEGGLDDVGYHIAGFDREGHAHLHHRFWGTPRPNPEDLAQDYRFSDHNPSPQKPLQLVYNGRNDIAHTVVTMLINEIEAGKEVGFDLTIPVELACFGDFVARMAPELTPEVGPPFSTFLIAPGNQIERIRNDSFSPVDREKVSLAIRLLYDKHQSLPLQSLPPMSFGDQAHQEPTPIPPPSGVAVSAFQPSERVASSPGTAEAVNLSGDKKSPQSTAGTVTVASLPYLKGQDESRPDR